MFKIKLITIYAGLSIGLTPIAYYNALYNDTPELIVDVSMYNAKEDQCDADPLITAGMYHINPSKASQHKWIAISRDLHSRWGGELNFGDKVYLSGTEHKDGVYKVADVMNKRFKNKIDILETVGTKEYQFKNVTITKL